MKGKNLERHFGKKATEIDSEQATLSAEMKKLKSLEQQLTDIMQGLKAKNRPSTKRPRQGKGKGKGRGR